MVTKHASRPFNWAKHRIQHENRNGFQERSDAEKFILKSESKIV